MVKKLWITLFAMPFLTLSSLGFALQSESRYVWGFNYEGLDLKIYAPYYAYPGDWVTVRVLLEAKAELSHIYVNISLYGSKSEGYDTWYYSFYAFYDAGLYAPGTLRDLDFHVQIPLDISPGLIYSVTECSWEVKWGWVWYSRSKDGVFEVTYVKNRDYENYVATHIHNNTEYDDYVTGHSHTNAEYDSYVAGHTHTNTEYDSLQADYNNLKSTYEFAGPIMNVRTLMFLFIATTATFIATTIYFAKRKPK